MGFVVLSCVVLFLTVLVLFIWYSEKQDMKRLAERNEHTRHELLRRFVTSDKNSILAQTPAPPFRTSNRTTFPDPPAGPIVVYDPVPDFVNRILLDNLALVDSRANNCNVESSVGELDCSSSYDSSCDSCGSD